MFRLSKPSILTIGFVVSITNEVTFSFLSSVRLFPDLSIAPTDTSYTPSLLASKVYFNTLEFSSSLNFSSFPFTFSVYDLRLLSVNITSIFLNLL